MPGLSPTLLSPGIHGFRHDTHARASAHEHRAGLPLRGPLPPAGRGADPLESQHRLGAWPRAVGAFAVLAVNHPLRLPASCEPVILSREVDACARLRRCGYHGLAVISDHGKGRAGSTTRRRSPEGVGGGAEEGRAMGVRCQRPHHAMLAYGAVSTLDPLHQRQRRHRLSGCSLCALCSGQRHTDREQKVSQVLDFAGAPRRRIFERPFRYPA